MDGIRIENVSNVKHLGHILTGDLLDSKDIIIIAQTAVYNRNANAILSDFKYIASQIRVNIKQSYCTSFYGSQLCDLSSNTIERLCTSWRKAMNIHTRTHCVYVPLLCNCLPLRMQLETRSVKFYVHGLNSKNDVFCFLMRSATLNRMSTIGTNIINILFKYKISPHKMYQSTYASVAKCIAVMYDKNVSDGDKIQASVLRDCINLRDNTSHYNCLTYDEATCVIDYVALA